MLALGAGLTAERGVVEPVAHLAGHVDFGWGKTLGEDGAGLLFSNAVGERPFVDASGDVAEAVELVAPDVLQDWVGVGQGALAVLQVLEPGLTVGEELVDLGVALGELLEAEGTVAKDLAADVARGVD